MSPDARLFAVNIAPTRLAIFDVTPTGLVLAAEVSGRARAGRRRGADRRRGLGRQSSLGQRGIVRVDQTDVGRSRVVRTLLTCDEPRDVVFAGTGGGRAFVTVARAARGCPVAFDPTTGASAARWCRCSTRISACARRHADREPRALRRHAARARRTDDGSTVYAAVFQSGNASTTINQRVVSATGGPPPPASALCRNGPQVGLIVSAIPRTDASRTSWAATGRRRPVLAARSRRVPGSTPTRGDAVGGRVRVRRRHDAVQPRGPSGNRRALRVQPRRARNDVRFGASCPTACTACAATSRRAASPSSTARRSRRGT